MEVLYISIIIIVISTTLNQTTVDSEEFGFEIRVQNLCVKFNDTQLTNVNFPSKNVKSKRKKTRGKKKMKLGY